ncbi:hypothetical protein Axi01nite_28890 [Actinoplanes xinjiangensis]|nr:hypothetical protein Axi01nite_28890 [Actinoplanes xinjiangensis]
MDESATVVVVGFGAAGACAAIEAAESGADVLIIDRFTGGGATAISGGIVYAGGGTRQQRAAGVTDTPTAMYDYLRHEVRDAVTPATLRRFCDESADMLAWLEDHGVPFDARLCPYKTSYPTNRHYLYQSGSEHGHPAPAPRGHRTHAPGTSGGTLHARLAAAAFARRIRFLPQSRAVTLLLSPTPHTSTPTAPHPHPSTPTWPPPPSQPPGDSAESQPDPSGWSSPLSQRPGDSGGSQPDSLGWSSPLSRRPGGSGGSQPGHVGWSSPLPQCPGGSAESQPDSLGWSSPLSQRSGGSGGSQPGHVGWSSPLSQRAGGSGENQPVPGAGPAASSATRSSPFPRGVADTEVPQSDRVGWSSPLSQTAGDSGGSQPDSDDDRLSSVRAGSGSGVDGLGERVVGVVCRTLRGAPGWARVAHRWLHRWSVKPGVYVPGFGRVLHRAVAWIEECYGQELRIHADAVVLAAGGFVFDREMMREHAPGYRGLRLGTPGDDGAGIRLGTAAGAGTRHLDRVTLWRFLTPPSALLGGVLVDRAGLRVCDESRYGAAIGEAIRASPDGRAWLLVDSDVLREAWRQVPSQTLWFQRWQSWWLFTARRTSAATLSALARRAGIDEATLAATVAANNAVAGNPVANNFAAATNAAATNAAADNAADGAVAVNEAAAEGGGVSASEAAAEGGAASTNDAGAADEGGEAVTDGAVAAGDSVVAADDVVVAAGVADAAVGGPARDEVGKPVALVRPLVKAPFSLIDVSLRAVPAPMLTLGGLIVDEETGRVLTPSGASISGLYAAGRTAVGICSGSYVSGLSLADCVFSGRRAGRHAATASAALEVRTSAATPTTEAATPATATTPPTAATATPASAMATPATPATVAATPTTTTATPTTATAATTPAATAPAATTPTTAPAATTPTIATAAVTPGTPAVTPATVTPSAVTATAITATSPADAATLSVNAATSSGGVAAGASSASVFSGSGTPADSSSTAADVASSGGPSGSPGVDAVSASGGAESGASAAGVESGSESEGTHDQRD